MAREVSAGGKFGIPKDAKNQLRFERYFCHDSYRSVMGRPREYYASGS
jgi:hypothetical protein